VASPRDGAARVPFDSWWSVTDAIGRVKSALADRYAIERELGAGGMATVYLAHDVRHDRPVALKVLRAELAAVIGAERFLAEIKTTANLQHPHILPLFDLGSADAFLYYVMPCVEGESLRDRLAREKQLPVPEAVRITTEVAEALEYAHQQGVIHRDIKPENILLLGGHALVPDFGIALAVTKIGGPRMTETGMSLGTPTYTRPEQAMGEQEITPTADVYALGCVLYEMLLGEPPFTGPTAQAVVAKVMTEKPGPIVARRERVPGHVEDAVFTALEKLPADRFATAAEFAEALARPGVGRASSHGTSRGGGTPRELLDDVREADWFPDGSALAIVHEVSGKDRLEYPMGHTLYESPGYLSDVRVAPRGDAVALFENPYRWDDRGSVIVVDREGRRRVLSQGYDGLEGLAWSPDAHSVRFSGGVRGLVNQIREAEPGGRARLVLPSAGSLTIAGRGEQRARLVTGDDQQDRLFVRAPGATADRDLSWLDASQEPLLSADGRVMAFTDAGLDAGVNYAVMLRRADGSPVVRLGEGYPADLSADGRWVLAIIQSAPQQMIELYPTGPGQARRLDRGELQSFSGARFFPDGRRLLVCGNAPEHAPRCYVTSLDGAPWRPVTPEGTDFGLVSRDGREVVAHLTSGGYRIYAVEGGAPWALGSLTTNDQVVGWSLDGGAVWVCNPYQIPMRVERVDVATGRRSLLDVIAPEDRSDLLSVVAVSLARDPHVHAYQTREYVSHLFTVEEMQ
jgi:dipeptidyl aminopeptidase/acylaminoacyl peptidase